MTYKAAAAHTHLDLWRYLLSSTPDYTGEVELAGQRFIYTGDPENIKAILATQFTEYGKGEPFHEDWKDFLGDSIFATDGPTWRNSRQLIRPSFVKDRISDLDCFESHIQTLFRAMAHGKALDSKDQVIDMSASATDGKRFDICDLFFRYTLDVITEFLLGHDVESLRYVSIAVNLYLNLPACHCMFALLTINSYSTPRQKFADSFNEVQRVQSIIARLGPFNKFVPRKSFNEGLKVMDEFINSFVKRAIALSPEDLASKTKTDEGYTFIHELSSFTRDPKILRDQIVAVLLAGRDTTASTLSWAIYEMSRHPHTVARLRREILKTVGSTRTPTYADLKDMKYLQNIMNETLRLYPSVPFNVRMPIKDTTLPRGGGPDGSLPIPVLKNTPIAYSALFMQRRTDLYPEASDTFLHPDVFSPERWEHWQPKPWLYIPFNGGPRICIGQQFALTEMSYVLVRMFQRFDRVTSFMEEIDGGSPTLKAEIVLQPGDGVQVAFWQAKETA